MTQGNPPPTLPGVRHALLVTAAVAAIHAPFYGSLGLMDPWEPHYSEVARNMLRTGDFITPHWGSDWPARGACASSADCDPGWVCNAFRGDFSGRSPACRPKDIPWETEPFFSKPALPLWMAATGMALLGVGSWGARLFFLLAGLYAVCTLSWAIGRLGGRRAGTLAGFALGATPLYALMTRQVMTDLPFVAFMTCAAAHLCVSWWDDDPDLDRPAPRGFAALAVAVAAAVVPQSLLVGGSLGMRLDGPAGMDLPAGPLHAISWLAAAGWALRSAWTPAGAPTARRVHLHAFYALTGVAVLSKGLLGLALPGLTALLYLFVSGEWRRLRTLEPLRGAALGLAVGAPWYAAMFARHHPDFFERFFIHDHLQRLAAGVHQIDSGGFEHYALWIGLGLFPWSALLPAAALRETCAGPRTGRDRVRVFWLLWLVATYAVLTLARTKFHHYVFPIAPAAAVLCAFLLDDGLAGRASNAALSTCMIAAAGLLALLAGDLARNPQQVINLVTYVYDRNWPEGLDALGAELGFLGALAFLAPTLWLVPRAGMRRVASRTMVAAALIASAWTSHRYIRSIAPTWSQRGLFEAYWNACTYATPARTLPSGRARCQEPLVAYKTHWRGETFLSEGTVVPLSKRDHLDWFLESEEGQGAFFALTEWRRLDVGFVARLDETRRAGVRRIHDANAKFALVWVPPAP